MTDEVQDEEEGPVVPGRRGHLFRWVFGAMVSVVGLGIAFLSYLDSQNDAGEVNPTIALCRDALPADELTDASLGEQVIAGGEVAENYLYEGENSALFINLGGENPNQDLTIVAWEENLGNWKAIPPEDVYDEGRTVAVTGRLDQFEGRFQIEVNSPGDAVICQ